MKSPPGRRPLSVERIVTSALRLVDRHGVEALSMRRLGAALRVEAMSLYKHVPDKGALVELVVDRVRGDVEAPPAGASWDDRLRHVAGELRRVALAHPHVFPLVATRAPSSAAAFASLEVVLGAFRDAGLDDEAALRRMWMFLAYVTGALLAETAAITGRGAASIVVPPGLGAADFPNLNRVRAAMASCDFATEYERGLEILVASAGSAARSSGPPVAKRRLRASPRTRGSA